MAQEHQLQKRLNEICFPEYTKDGYEIVNSNWQKYSKVTKITRIKSLLPISLELILKALNSLSLNILEVNIANKPILSMNIRFVRFKNQNEILIQILFSWILNTPFSLQPTETKEAIYKIFEIE